jgi:hypothetical protein
MEGILKGQRIQPFDGKKDEFAQWSYIFLSTCHIAGCKMVLIDDTYQVPADNVDLMDIIDPDTVKQLERRKANGSAYALLTVSVKDTTGFQAIRNAVTINLPNGCARSAWKNYLEYFNLKQRLRNLNLNNHFLIVSILKKHVTQMIGLRN